jgi:hypothetical protein
MPSAAPMISETSVLDRPGQYGHDLGNHGLTGDHGYAPVTGQGAREKLGILNVDRLIEAKPDTQRVQGLFAGEVSQYDLGGIAGQDTHGNEDQREDEEAGDDGQPHAPDKESQHVGLLARRNCSALRRLRLF